MDNFYIKVSELYWIVQDITGSADSDTVTVEIRRLSDGYTWNFNYLYFENASNTGTPTFVNDILWKTSFTPPTEDTYVVTFNDTTLSLKNVQVLNAVGGDEAVSLSTKSEVKIANLALKKIGASRINSLDEDSEQARVISEMFPTVRDEVLRSHPWNFAVDRIALSLLSDTPIFEYDYQFQLPSNCLRPIGAYDASGNAIEDYKIEGRKLLCNEDAVNIKYIKRVTDVSQFDSIFVSVLATRLAAEAAFPLANSASLATEMYNIYTDMLKYAKSIDGQESSSVETQGDDDWENTRQ